MSSHSTNDLQVATWLAATLSERSRVLTNSSSSEFQESMKRWSDVDVQTPSAIFLPSCEDDVVRIVDYAIKSNIPIVAKSGGNSLWSTIAGGWIIDMALLDTITIDPATETATIQSGVLMKHVNEAVSSSGFMTPYASGSSVGYIPFLLGGGNSPLVGMCGMAVDSLVSARIVTAKEGLVTASHGDNAELFWALKEAGQFFGIVTEVTIKLFPLAKEIFSWTCTFLPKHIEEVASALKVVVDRVDAKSSGMAAVTVPPGPPGQTKPILIVSVTHFRPEAEAQMIMGPLLAINPVNQIKKTIPFSRLTDSAETLMRKGGLKGVVSCGLQTFEASKFERCLEAWTRLVEGHPDAASSFFMFIWASTEKMKKLGDQISSYSHRDCAVWSMLWPSATKERAFNAAVQAAEDVVAFCQGDQRDSEKALFANHTRVKSIEQRYRGEERRSKLGDLKRAWDPEGVFTKQLLN